MKRPISTFRDNQQDADKVQSVAETIIHEITHYGVFQVYGGERNVYNNPWMPPNMFRSGSTQIKEAYRKQGEMTAKINDLVRATQLTMNDAFLMLQNVGNQEAYAQDQWAREILPHIVQTICNWEATDKSKAIRDQAEEKVSKGDKGDKGDEKKLAIDKMIIDEMDKMLEVFRTDLERKVTELEHESSA